MKYDSLEERFFNFLDFECAFESLGDELGFDCVKETVTAPYHTKHQGPYMIPFQVQDTADVKLYLERALRFEKAPIDSDVFCVLNLEEYYIFSEYKTLVFYTNGFLAKTNETSRTLMNRLFAKVGVPYEFMRPLLRLLTKEEQHCVPYVMGKHALLPIHGPTKKSVSWVNLANLTAFYKIYANRSHTRFEFANRHTIELPMRYQTVEASICSAQKLYVFQQRKIQELNQFFQMDQRFLLTQIDEEKVPEISTDDILKVVLLALWKKEAKRCPHKQNPHFQQANSYLERKLSFEA